MAAVCRNGRHPLEGNRVAYAGKRTGTYCRPCHVEAAHRRNAAVPVRRDGWAEPVVDRERRQRREMWIASVGDAIARIRAEEGFDGRKRTWRTLGECLPEEIPQEPMRLNRYGGRRIAKCDRCRAPRWYGQPCALCAAGLDGRRLVS